MYIAYETEKQNGMEYVFPIGIFRNKKDVEQFKEMTTEYINFEKVPMIDMRKIKPIKYIKFWYCKGGSFGWSKGITNSLLVKQPEKFNRAHIFNGTMTITKIIREDEDIEDVAKKLEKLCPKLLLKKELGELSDSEESGIRMNSVFVQVDVKDLLEKI